MWATSSYISDPYIVLIYLYLGAIEAGCLSEGTSTASGSKAHEA